MAYNWKLKNPRWLSRWSTMSWTWDRSWQSQMTSSSSCVSSKKSVRVISPFLTYQSCKRSSISSGTLTQRPTSFSTSSRLWYLWPASLSISLLSALMAFKMTRLKSYKLASSLEAFAAFTCLTLSAVRFISVGRLELKSTFQKTSGTSLTWLFSWHTWPTYQWALYTMVMNTVLRPCNAQSFNCLSSN